VPVKEDLHAHHANNHFITSQLHTAATVRVVVCIASQLVQRTNCRNQMRVPLQVVVRPIYNLVAADRSHAGIVTSLEDRTESNEHQRETRGRLQFVEFRRIHMAQLNCKQHRHRW